MLPDFEQESTEKLAVAPFGESEAKQHQQRWAEFASLPLELANSIGMKLIYVPAGEFDMGSPGGEEARDADEDLHRARVNDPFYLGIYEVTQAEYQQVMGKNPSSCSPTGATRYTAADTSRFPVESVSCQDAVEFCRRLSELADEKLANRTYRLPIEAEWEFACRAGKMTPFHFGSTLNGQQANCNGQYPYGTGIKGPYLARPTTVGSYTPNAFGLYDMHGNVWEWCADAYGDYQVGSPTDDPKGPETDSNRVLRGGGWSFRSQYCRSAFRDRYSPLGRISYLGFRVARSPFGK